MWRSSPNRFDAATGLARGARPYQEDAVLADFPCGDDCGIAVLSDGMGGCAAGDVASALVVSSAFADLKLRFATLASREREIPALLQSSVARANRAVHDHVSAHPDAFGMGATLTATVLVGPHLYWVTVGDSPLFLVRDGALRRLNENHSMAPHIDALIAAGQISPEAGRHHPDRSQLTSAIAGQRVARIDCPATPFALMAGDILVVSSDGLHTLDDAAIARLVWRNRKRPSVEIVGELLAAVQAANDAEQDNCSIALVRVLSEKPAAQTPPAGRAGTAGADGWIELFDAVVLEEPPPAPARKRAVGL